MSPFRPFSLAHGLTVGVCLFIAWGLIALGRRWRGSDKEDKLGLVLGGFIACVNVWSALYWALPPTWNIRESLPIQLCDVACLMAPVALITRQRFARSILFYWGIGLSSQAFITPTLRHGIETERFWIFWLVHLAIVGTAIYDLVVRGYRPTWADFRRMLPIGAGYLAVVLFLNWRLGSNYGYLGETLPENTTIIDALGPWPWRIPILVFIGVSLMASMTAIGLRRSHAGPAPAPARGTEAVPP